MSRKKLFKSNIPYIGIFTVGDTKTITYNTTILLILNKLQYATAWQIAKKIAEQQKPSPNMDMETRSRRIYSVIQRKNGRLIDLQKKGYVKLNEENLWGITRKGYFALAIAFPEILETVASSTFTLDVKNIPEKLPFGITINREETKKELNRIITPVNVKAHCNLFIKTLAEFLEEGIDLDRVTEDTLLALMATSSSYKKTLKGLY